MGWHWIRNLFHDSVRIFFIFARVWSSSEIYYTVKSCFMSEMNSKFNFKPLNLLFITFSWVFWTCFFKILGTSCKTRRACYFHDILILSQCENISMWRYHFYSIEKNMVFHDWKFFSGQTELSMPSNLVNKRFILLIFLSAWEKDILILNTCKTNICIVLLFLL